MSFPVHTVQVKKGSDLNRVDQLDVYLKKQIANAAGSGAGAAVTLAVAVSLPAKYAVFVSPSQDATWWITNRTQAGFTINLAPRLAANTLAVGTLDLMVVA